MSVSRWRWWKRKKQEQKVLFDGLDGVAEMYVPSSSGVIDRSVPERDDSWSSQSGDSFSDGEGEGGFGGGGASDGLDGNDNRDGSD